MKSFNQNRIQADKVEKTNTRASFFSKITQKSHAIAAAIIFAVIVLHFASQFVFFQTEDDQRADFQAKKSSSITETLRNVQIEPEYDAENLKIAAMPESNLETAVKSKIKTAPSRTAVKKVEPRESKTERLRRAEKILTGF